MSFQSLLNLSCNIEINSSTQDAAGQMIYTWITLSSNIPCRLDPAEDGLQTTMRAIYERVTHILFMEIPTISPALNTQDHRIDINGEKYSILLISKVYGYSNGHHLEILLEKLS